MNTQSLIEVFSTAIPLLMKGAFLTLQISFLALCIGTILGTFMGILSCKKINTYFLNQCVRTYVVFIRGTPVFIQLLIVYFALPELIGLDISPVCAGILTLGMNSTAYVSEIMRGGINSIALGQWEACHALGYSQMQTLRFVILPQTIKNMLPALANESISLIKESSILMVLGVAELTKVSKDIVARELRPMEIYLLTALLYLIMTTLLAQVVKKWERSYDYS